MANAEPPVCKIMDYNKHLFDLKQKQKDAKKKQHQVQVKEIKLRPGTDVGDYNVKLRAITKFLEEGNKVKITLRFRGREMAHQELGLAQLQKIEADVAEFGVIEQAPKMEGRQMGMLIGPRKRNNPFFFNKNAVFRLRFLLLRLAIEVQQRLIYCKEAICNLNDTPASINRVDDCACPQCAINILSVIIRVDR